MALQKQPVTINFAKGLNLKTDPYQVSVGNFLALQNSIFDTEGRLSKRNGFANITNLPNSEQTTLATLNDNLLATGSHLYAFNENTGQWMNQGIVQPVSLSVSPLVRVSTSQSSPDLAVDSDGLACLVYVDNSLAYYQLSDSSTGQQVVARTALPSTAASPRVFLLGRYFIITFMATVSASTHLQYIAIPIAAPGSPSAATDIDTTVRALTTGYDGHVANNTLYLAWSGSSTTIRMRYMSSTLVVSTATTVSGSHTSTFMSVTADTSASTPVIWISFWDSSSTNGYVAAYNPTLVSILAPTKIIDTTSINQITSIATDGSITVIYENANNYNSTGAYPNAVKTDFLSKVSVTQAGAVGSTSVILRSVGLASKPFIDTNGTTYLIATYGETNQPTYFLINSSGNIIMRLAYSNGGGYEASQVLPTVSLVGTSYMVPYQIKDFLASVNKNTNPGSPTSAIYTQTGINLAKFSINVTGQFSSEIAGALHLTGGQLWEYDGVRPVEHGFHVWPENVAYTTATTTGNLTAQIYNYVFTYEWTDNQGNLHRSAPSIPLTVDLSGTGVSTNKNTLYVPTLRLTDKIAPNPVRIVGYRWSTGQQVYYQFTSLTSPTANDTTVDYVTIVDTLADSSILGNTLLYTTGGVIENIAAPACIGSTLFKSRLFLIDAEDPNLLWYSKQVIENTPVEMSDLLTIYVAPTTGVQGSTGKMTAISALDDKLIIFKENAIYYITGNGPNNTGEQNDFAEPVFVTSAVGCSNPRSIVMQPNGLMFQSNKGIWLLARDLSTTYIGAPVDAFNSNSVQSADSIPGTNQVRFILDNGVTLMYDYFYNQWGTFTNISAISSVLYQGYQTYLNEFGSVYQEAPGTSTDGSVPVLMSFQTAWISLAGLRGFERFYFMFLLGTYLSPFKLNVQISYDFFNSPAQSIMVTPDNYAPNWGEEAVWGSGGPWGGTSSNVFQARVFPSRQKCQTFQLTVNEIYDSSLGVAAGKGLTLSGINMVLGFKKGYNTQKGSRSFG